LKAAVFQGVGTAHRIEQVEEPTPTENEVLIKVVRSGICATDLTMTARHDPPSPLEPLFRQLCPPGSILGHEIAGEVVEIGKAVMQLRPGDRVVPTAFFGCGTCLSCRSGKPDWCADMFVRMGGYSEFTVAPAAFCVPVPEASSLDECALFEPLATSLHTVHLAHPRPADRVAIRGAGTIGLGVAYFARMVGARRVAVIARTGRQRDLALELGADVFLSQSDDPDTTLADALGGPADIVVEASGAPGALDQTLRWVRPGGTIVVPAMNALPDTVNHGIAVMKEVRVQYAASYVLEDLRVIADLFSRSPRPLLRLVSSQITLDEFPETFERLRTDRSECKVQLRFD
jgi:(R,R)-butanediol dehydrogenase/meso-butanediol dehydrogenase/diacetyl reductase